jgi:hypothetical protein
MSGWTFKDILVSSFQHNFLLFPSYLPHFEKIKSAWNHLAVCVSVYLSVRPLILSSSMQFISYKGEEAISSSQNFFFYLWGGVKLIPLGTLFARWWWRMWSIWWNDNWQGIYKYSEKSCPSEALSATNPTWSDLGSNAGCLGGNLANNRLSYVTAFLSVTQSVLMTWW